MAAEAEVKDLRKERESVVGDKGLVKTFFNSGGVLHHSNAATPLSQVFLIVPLRRRSHGLPCGVCGKRVRECLGQQV